MSCPSCCGLVKVAAGNLLLPREYEHPSMQSVNQAMRKSPILNAVAEKMSKKVGKPWYESTFTSIPASDRQFRRVHEVALVAAQRLGLPKMPSVYVESSRGYASATYGSQKDAFVNIGSFLPRLLRDRELLFVVGHEYGHLIGQHALWMTVSNFMFGEHRSSLMADGVLGLLNPVRLVGAGVEAVITNWMRIADFTADRVGLLAVGDFETARRALFLLYQKSRADLAEVDLDEWMRQQEQSDPQIVKVSQLMSSGAPYLGVRLNELKRFSESPQYRAARDKVEAASGVTLAQLFDEEGFLRSLGRPGAPRTPPPRAGLPQPAGVPSAGVLRGSCPKCGKRLRISLRKPPAQDRAKVTCPVCEHVFTLQVAKILEAQTRGRPASAVSPTASHVRVVRRACPNCQKAFAIPLGKLPRRPYMDVQCSACQHKYRLSLTEVRAMTP